jgi:NAD(P)-dependent dehydrogenase (short-subunit alcohol dehydrogenase family)
VTRRVLVTGGASGLGAALVEAFRAAGDEVLSTDLHGGDLALDITSDDDWAAALAHVEQTWGGLDILVNNAGIAGGGRIELSTIEEWRWITEVNLLGVVGGTRTFTPLFKSQGSGHVVNVASLAGLVHAAGMGSYNAVKAAVVAFTETTGHELDPFGIKASVVCPSYFKTNLLSSMRGSDRRVGEVVAGLIARSTVTAQEVAEAVLAGIAAGDDVIVPDEPARQAYALKWGDRAAYNALMRHQAARLAAPQ